MRSSCPARIRSRVTLMSASLGVGSPLGWLWTRMMALARRAMAAAKTPGHGPGMVSSRGGWNPVR